MTTVRSSDVRCAIYLRVSSKEQATEAHMSLKEQRQTCLAFASKWEVVGDGQTGDSVFVDVRSGLDTEQRDAYQRVLSLTRTKPQRINTIVVWKYDRFGRDDAELIARYAELRRLGVTLISATEGEQQPLTLKFLALLQYEESRRTSERVKPILARIAEEGRWTGRIPFGYASAGAHTGLLVEAEHTGEVVRGLFARYAAGGSLNGLTRWLNTSAGADGGPLPSPMGSTWRLNQVRNVLANVSYTGRRRIGWASNSKITGRTRANPGARTLQGLHPRLVDDETFDAVAGRLGAMPHRGRVCEHRQWLLTGMIVCGECGHRMSGGWVYDRRVPGSNRRQGRYICRAGHGKPGSNRIDQAVRDAVGRLPLTKADIARAVGLFADRTAQLPDRTSELAGLRAQAQRELDRATDLVLKEVLSEVVYRQKRQGLEAEIARLDGETARLTAPAHGATRVLSQLAAWLEDAGNVGTVLEQGDLEEQASVIMGAVEKVTYRKGRPLEITWRPWAAALQDALVSQGA